MHCECGCQFQCVVVEHSPAIHSKNVVLPKKLNKTFAQNTHYCKSQTVIYSFLCTQIFLKIQFEWCTYNNY